MTIHTLSRHNFELKSNEYAFLGGILYDDTSFKNALITITDSFKLKLLATGVWITTIFEDSTEKILTNIKMEPGGMMSIRKFCKRKKYFFKRSANWKLRFYLTNSDGEELLSLLPSVNWEMKSHHFVLQLNDEFEKECDSFLILHALHCANCSLSIMEGGKVPALVSL